MSAHVLPARYYPAADDVFELELQVAAEAKCAGAETDDWYPIEGTAQVPEGLARSRVAYAKARCSGCPVITECLQLALAIPAGQHGVWGGTTAQERRAMLRARNATRRHAAQAAAAAERAEDGTPVGELAEAVGA